jgi:hypothetical protein
MKNQKDIDQNDEEPVAAYSPKNNDDTEWSDRDFGIDEDIDPADRRHDPLRR